MINVTDLFLARSGEDDWMKIVFGVGAVIVWGLFQLMGAAAKKAEEAKRRRQYGQFPEDVTTYGYNDVIAPPSPPVDPMPYGYGGRTMPPPVPVQVPPGYGVPRPQQQQQQGKRKGNAGRGKGSKRQAAAAQAAQVAQRDVPTVRQAYEATPAPSGELGPRASRNRSGAPAGQIARLLRRPDSLRAAFILNEVLSKPAALRDDSRR